MGESLKFLSNGAKVLARRSNAKWDIQLATDVAAKALVGNILITKLQIFQTEYIDTQNT